ncbi:MAG: hypothetical protein R2697_14890 [Ilumatobacteraceae bacterium]
MTTGRSTVSSCAACAPLAGNPSDRYGGALVAMPLTDLTAMAALREAGGEFTHRSSDPELVAIVEATVATYAERGAELPPVELSLSTNIPPGVGLGRTAALVIATLRSLAAFDGRRSWPADDLAATALAVLHGLGADAAPGDVLVQAHARPLSMTFGPDVVEPLALPDELAPFVAWSADDTTAIGASIDAARTSQRSLRRRFEGGDPDVVAAMGELRVQAGRSTRHPELRREAARRRDAPHPRGSAPDHRRVTHRASPDRNRPQRRRRGELHGFRQVGDRARATRRAPRDRRRRLRVGRRTRDNARVGRSGPFDGSRGRRWCR